MIVYNIVRSPQRIQVWKLLAEGYTTKQIAEMIGIAEKTAEGHQIRLKRKMGMNLAQLTLEAIKIGLIEL